MTSLDDLAIALATQSAQGELAKQNPYFRLGGTAESIGGLAQQMVLQDPQRYSMKEGLAASLITGLLSGGLSSVGDEYQGTLTDRYKTALTTAMGGGTPSAQGLSPSLFKGLDQQVKIFKLQKQVAQEEKVQELISDVLKARGTSQATEEGKLAAYGIGEGAAGVLNPVSKETRDMERQSRDALRTTPMVQNFQDIKTNFDTLLSTYEFNDKPATLAFVSSFARILDPGSVVREGEIKNVENTQSFLSSLGYSIQSLVNGSQSIGPEAKQQMVRAAASKYNRFGEDFSKFLTQNQSLVERQGGKKENVFAPIAYDPFDFKSWASTAKQETLQDTLSGAAAPAGTPNIAQLKSDLAVALKVRKAGMALSAQQQQLIDMATGLIGK